MTEEQRTAISSMGGKAAHAAGKAHTFDSEEAKAAGRKGGEVVSKDRDHMVEIGRRGGRARGKQRNRGKAS
jgi:general stress protein YciG